MHHQEILHSFNDFNFKSQLLKGIIEAGFKIPSPIQIEAIPYVLGGHDLIAQAQTGTGKTAAFALPIIQNLKNSGSIEALIITPTRELAMQISDEVYKLGRFCNTRTVSIYGGQSIHRQVDLLKKCPQVIIATPGRLLDHLRNDRMGNFSPSMVVLDESDEMLDMGFLDDIEEIFTYLPSYRQTLLFSATMPLPIKNLAKKILNNPKIVKIAATEATNSDISQRYYIINEHEREDAIVRLIDSETPTKTIIFTRMKKEADNLSHCLKARGYLSGALHGDMEQRDRQQTIKLFKQGDIDILVATDVAARGLDISDVSHVFNYHIPLNSENYVHRIGRTGRAGKKGIAVTLATPLEFKEIKRITENTKAKIELYEIPTIAQTLKNAHSKLIAKMLTTEISDEALRLYEQLSEEMETSQLACKLLSVLLNNHAISGPNKIGLNKEDLAKIKNSLLRYNKKTTTDRRRGGFRGDNGFGRKHSRSSDKRHKPNRSNR
ncbi:DEAD/DEAH box helicase [Helicobacter monodelphidis]|uniref:DEAD/DEAH box helicase n=1 Tax=Helicobacter sp. 15-1451 TaxID=2004995 RepID=UPI000DCCC79B|nr:DEAD/DEAH box helicase [Helicobacter sp. 15-1451]RAX59201.1 DEAD/DEAH box helicase [Helicobacter sp. 15-1451]